MPVVVVAAKHDYAIPMDQFESHHQGAVQESKVELHLDENRLAAIERIARLGTRIRHPYRDEPELLVSGPLRRIVPDSLRSQLTAPVGQVLMHDGLGLAIVHQSSPIQVEDART